MDQFVDDLVIEKFERAPATINNRDIYAKGGKHRCIFDPDHATADDDDAARNFLDVEYLVAVDHELSVDLKILRR